MFAVFAERSIDKPLVVGNSLIEEIRFDVIVPNSCESHFSCCDDGGFVVGRLGMPDKNEVRLLNVSFLVDHGDNFEMFMNDSLNFQFKTKTQRHHKIK